MIKSEILEKVSNLACGLGFHLASFLKKFQTWHLKVQNSATLHVSIILHRKVVEHVCLLKAKENLSEEEEKNMLDYLYTSQYQMRGIVAISVGEGSRTLA